MDCTTGTGETCGGTNRLSIYQYNAALVSESQIAFVLKVCGLLCSSVSSGIVHPSGVFLRRGGEEVDGIGRITRLGLGLLETIDIQEWKWAL